MVFISTSEELVASELDHLPFGSSLSASLACLESRRLSAVHFRSPYRSLLALDRLDAGSPSYIVREASYLAVTGDARSRRSMLVEQQVMS